MRWLWIGPARRNVAAGRVVVRIEIGEYIVEI
jgi:hypothetical protein